jgi:hypothetical protein
MAGLFREDRLRELLATTSTMSSRRETSRIEKVTGESNKMVSAGFLLPPYMECSLGRYDF